MRTTKSCAATTSRYWQDYAHRLRVLRQTLDISEMDAAVAHGVTVRTYRKWEAGNPQRASDRFLRFADKYDVSLDWLCHGNGFNLGRHLTVRSDGKVAILPAISAKRKAVQS
jgi:transcriptional regulator with XRE-family HTH domain